MSKNGRGFFPSPTRRLASSFKFFGLKKRKKRQNRSNMDESRRMRLYNQLFCCAEANNMKLSLSLSDAIDIEKKLLPPPKKKGDAGENQRELGNEILKN